MDKLRLLEDAKGGDQAALNQLLENSRKTLRSVVARRMGDQLRSRLEVTDILQSTYVAIVHSIPRFGGVTEEEFVRWVLRILENNIKNRVRYFQADKRNSGHEGASLDVYDYAVPDAGPSPSEELVFADELVSIGRAMAKIAPRYRKVLMLHLKGLSHKRIAEIFQRSEGACKLLLLRARTVLQAEIERGSAGP